MIRTEWVGIIILLAVGAVVIEIGTSILGITEKLNKK